MERTKVLVNGAKGKMGQEVIKAVLKEAELELVAQADISDDLAEAVKKSKPDVVIDFTIPKSAMANIRTAAQNKCHVIVGTTGITEKDLAEIKGLCEKNGVNILVAPNFAVGAVLMMKYAADAAKYLSKAEIIELHHDQKLDAPSGTALKTAEMIKRSSNIKDIPIHSVRLPGFVADQEVIFGGLGQTLSIKHRTIGRESFMPGVVLAAKKIKSLKGLTYGLENIL